jgi:hypothetical protein
MIPRTPEWWRDIQLWRRVLLIAAYLALFAALLVIIFMAFGHD